MRLDSVRATFVTTFHAAPKTRAAARLSHRPCATGTGRVTRTTRETFAATRESLALFAQDTQNKWLLPHRLHITWPYRCRKIARHLMQQAGNGLGAPQFPTNWQRDIHVPLADGAPNFQRYALALTLWNRSLLAIAASPGGCTLKDSADILSAAANNTAQVLSTHKKNLTREDAARLQAQVANLQSAAQTFREGFIPAF